MDKIDKPFVVCISVSVAESGECGLRERRCWTLTLCISFLYDYICIIAAAASRRGGFILALREMDEEARIGYGV